MKSSWGPVILLYFSLSLGTAFLDANRIKRRVSLGLPTRFPSAHVTLFPCCWASVFHANLLEGSNDDADDASQETSITKTILSVEEAMERRTSCKRFARYDGTDRASGKPSESDPAIVQIAYNALKLSLRTPSAFNTQPYKVVLVHSPSQKAALAKFALGPNRSRVLDSDCTAVFLADRKIMLSFPQYLQFMRKAIVVKKKQQNRLVTWRNLFYISIFSSGYPLPRFFAAPFSFLIRCLFGVVHFFTRGFYPLPSLSSAETWSAKQVGMLAMSFLLVCTAKGVATIPMEGLNASSIRRVLGIPSRYAIPLMISIGRPYYYSNSTDEEERMENHASSRWITSSTTSPRYDAKDVIYSDTFRGVMAKRKTEFPIRDETPINR